MLKIALDAMGGDNAPGEIVKGAVEATRKLDDIIVILVGDRAQIDPLLETAGADSSRLETFHCTQVVEMGEKATKSLRTKPDSSIKRCAELVAQGDAVAMISAGNTGAQVAVSSFIMGLLPQVTRPGIAVDLPGSQGPMTTLDVGANVYCRPTHLFEYGIMGSVYQRYIIGKENPRVGLLSIGQEKTKGNSLVHETIQLFESSNLNFIGNVEGDAMLKGSCDVLVCDGFAGNILLKTSEGICEMLLAKILATVNDLKFEESDLVIGAIKKTMAIYDYSAYGGAPLFGCRGVSIISHGRSNSVAIANAIKSAREFARCQVTRHIVEELENNKALLEPTET